MDGLCNNGYAWCNLHWFDNACWWFTNIIQHQICIPFNKQDSYLYDIHRKQCFNVMWYLVWESRCHELISEVVFSFIYILKEHCTINNVNDISLCVRLKNTFCKTNLFHVGRPQHSSVAVCFHSGNDFRHSSPDCPCSVTEVIDNGLFQFLFSVTPRRSC